VGGGDATPLILIRCVRERFPSTDIEECGEIQNWCYCCRKQKILLLLPQNVTYFLEEEVNWMMIQSTRDEQIYSDWEIKRSNRM